MEKEKGRTIEADEYEILYFRLFRARVILLYQIILEMKRMPEWRDFAHLKETFNSLNNQNSKLLINSQHRVKNLRYLAT